MDCNRKFFWFYSFFFSFFPSSSCSPLLLLLPSIVQKSKVKRKSENKIIWKNLKLWDMVIAATMLKSLERTKTHNFRRQMSSKNKNCLLLSKIQKPINEKACTGTLRFVQEKCGQSQENCSESLLNFSQVSFSKQKRRFKRDWRGEEIFEKLVISSLNYWVHALFGAVRHISRNATEE